ncbi:hypothetical protein M569_10174 [Genlisea aurea]|uniref:Uncharacterized protein n=1 Tax=Genlisea aurea TaxID=192259 RepID=S8CCC6_9LAMI|nr:hypothetical protein M569_10174 [Genlisea aurea]
MRLYPPVAVDSVACIEDDTLPDGTFVGKGSFVSYLANSMGRMESIWGDDCGEYKPERMCLGKEMAYIQMKCIAASVLKKFSFDVLVEEGKVPQHVLSLTMRMKGGLPACLYELRKEWVFEFYEKKPEVKVIYH